jgi:hypothetical protein
MNNQSRSSDPFDALGVSEICIGVFIIIYTLEYYLNIWLKLPLGFSWQWLLESFLSWMIGFALLQFGLLDPWRNRLMHTNKRDRLKEGWTYFFGVIPTITVSNQAIGFQIGFFGFQFAVFVQASVLVLMYVIQSIALRNRRWKLLVAVVMSICTYLIYLRWAPDWKLVNGLEYLLFGLTATISGSISLYSNHEAAQEYLATGTHSDRDGCPAGSGN